MTNCIIYLKVDTKSVLIHNNNNKMIRPVVMITIITMLPMVLMIVITTNIVAITLNAIEIVCDVMYYNLQVPKSMLQIQVRRMHMAMMQMTPLSESVAALQVF